MLLVTTDQTFSQAKWSFVIAVLTRHVTEQTFGQEKW